LVSGVLQFFTSVADLGCLSRIPDPDFLPIPDPKTLTKERGEKKNFVATIFTELKIIYF
jgi:hypothetical protein